MLKQLFAACLGIGAVSAVLGAEWTTDELALGSVQQHWGKPQRHLSLDRNPLKIAGKTYTSGLGTHAPGKFSLRLDTQAIHMSGAVGIDDETGKEGKAELKIYASLHGERQLLWQSQPFCGGEAAQEFSVDLKGMEQVEFVYSELGDAFCDHVDLVDLKITYLKAAPQSELPNGGVRTHNVYWFLNAEKGKALTQSGFGSLDSTASPTEEMLPYPLRGKGAFLLDENLHIKQADGSHNVAWTFDHLETTEPAPGIQQNRYFLVDAAYPVRGEWVVTSYYEEDVIAAHLEIVNDGDAAVTLYERDAALVALPYSENAWISSFYGEWSNEMTLVAEDKVPNGVLKHQHRGAIRTAFPDWPGVYLSLDGQAQEESGNVFAAALAWTGSWQYKMSKVPQTHYRDGGLYFSTGAQADPVQLAAKSRYISPDVVMTWSSKGKGQASRNLHKYMNRTGLYQPQAKRRIVLNSWEGVYFDFDEAKVIQLMDGAADLGVEMFVLDDGWFGNGEFARNGDTAGLGDWQVNQAKLPHGLEALIDAAEARGLEFGLWVEPEMVNPKSQLFLDHPSWAMEVPHRERETARNQYVLDLSQPAVEEFVYQTVSGILEKHPRIHYIKWDHNCVGVNLGSPSLGDNQAAVSDLHNQAYYRIMDQLRKNYPNVTFQLCASGGGRVDYGSMRYNEEFWASDETNGLRRIAIQWGWSHFFPGKAIASHIGKYGEGDFKLRCDVAMTARLGVELSPSTITEADRAVVRQGIQAYKELRSVLHRAELYRGRSPHQSLYSELTLVLPDQSQAVFFAFQRDRNARTEKVKLAGLDSAAQYQVSEVNPDQEPRFTPGVFSGAELMQEGLEIHFPAKPSSAVAHLVRQ